MNSILDRIKNIIKKHWLKLTVLALSIVLIELAWIYSYSLREHVTKKNYPARNIDRITDYIETLDLKYDVIGRVNYYNKSYNTVDSF